MNHQWYYGKDGKQSGPVSMEELKALLANGTLDESVDLVWREGMPSWVTADKVPDLSISSPTPEPAPAAGVAAPAGAPPSFASPSQGAYVAPQNQMPIAGYDADPIQLPPVKRVNFPLMITLLILGVGLYAASVAVMLGPFITDIMNNPEKYQGPNAPEPEIDEPSPAVAFTLLAGLGLMLAGGIISLICIYRAWSVIRPWTSVATPGTAVGFLFIPLFQFYWMFIALWKWSVEWNRIVTSNPGHTNAPRMPEGLFLTLPIVILTFWVLSLIGLLGLTIIFIIVAKKMCEAIDYAAANSSQETYR